MTTTIMQQVFSLSTIKTHCLAASVLCGFYILRKFICPRHLRHLPRVPLLPTLYSLLSGETEDRRVHRLVLPLAAQNGHGLIVVWALGDWYVHIVDHKVCSFI